MSTESFNTPPIPMQALANGGGYELASGALVKARAEWSDGAFCMIESAAAPRTYLAPMHRHDIESQVIIVLSGRVGAYVEGSPEVELGPGGIAFRPAGLAHSLWNPTDERARYIEMTSPATKFQEFMLGNDELRRAGKFSRDVGAARAAEAGLELLPGDLDRELAEKHGCSLRAIFGEGD